MEKYIVYETRNKINGKVYIGATHARDDGYLGSSKFLKADVKKYGKENFEMEILFETDSPSAANIFESMLTPKWFCDLESTYNVQVGGGCYFPREESYFYGRKGKDHPRYGKPGHLKGKFGSDHPRYGGICHCRGKFGENHPNSKPVKVKGILYPSLSAAAKANKVVCSTIFTWINKNKNGAKYV